MSTLMGLVLLVASWLPGTQIAPTPATHPLASPHTVTASVTTARISALTPHVSIAHAAMSCSYTVQAGDYLSRIAPGNWQTIAAINNLSDPNFLYIGEILTMCGGASPPAQGVQNGVMQPQVTLAPSIKGPNTYPYGWCTFGAEALAHDDLNGLGDAPDWTVNAARRGLPTGYTAQAGATAVFAPGYHTPTWGTSAGHVAHVDVVSGGSMEITEMNNGYYGGFGRYDTVWVAIIPGMVSFIY